MDLYASDAETITIANEQMDGKYCTRIFYKSLLKLPINVTVSIRHAEEEPLTFWRLSLENNTQLCLECVDFLEIIIPNDLVGAGGDSRLLWPVMEGVLIEDADIRENSGWLTYRPVGYASKGIEGYYPGPASVQFMACYGTKGGLYVGAHDRDSNVKAIEFYKKDEGIKFEFRLFPGVGNVAGYSMEYDMVVGVFEEDWQDAANIYRNWYLEQFINKLPELQKNSNIPNWLKGDSPVIAIYRVRGTKDTGDMSPNEYYPYSNALPVINVLSDAFDSKFTGRLHEKGNLLGVYCSGLGWTDESVICPEYSRKAQFKSENLASIMCMSPEGDLPNALSCLENAIDHKKSQDDLLNRIAYSFTAGDLISVTLKGNGKINWGWNEDWNQDWNNMEPDQAATFTLIKQLNLWRKGFAKPFLCFGRMVKLYQLQHVDNWTMYMKDSREIIFPALLTSRWKSSDGREAQIVAN